MKPLLPHWKLNCDYCGSDGDDVTNVPYGRIDVPGGGHFHLDADKQMICEACKQQMIEETRKKMEELRKGRMKGEAADNSMSRETAEDIYGRE